MYLEKDKRWEENSVVLARGLTSGASRMAARSYKETTDVWEPQQSPGEKRGNPLTQRGSMFFCFSPPPLAAESLLLIPPARSDFPSLGGPGYLLESLTHLAVCKSFRALTLSWNPARRRWVVVATAGRSSLLC